MVAFACNHCANGFQLTNSVRFLACGVSDRVHDYLHYLGLASSKRTAVSALNRLALNAERKLRLVMASSKKSPMVPSICIDNLDMEQKVHNLSVGNRSHTFQGTWGYIHIPKADFMKMLWCPKHVTNFQVFLSHFFSSFSPIFLLFLFSISIFLLHPLRNPQILLKNQDLRQNSL
jgi:hypothetical protein